MFKRASKSVCTSPIAVSPYTLSPTPATVIQLLRLKNTEEVPDDPEPANEWAIHMEHSSD